MEPMQTCKWLMLVGCLVAGAGCQEVREAGPPSNAEPEDDSAAQGLQAEEPPPPPRCNTQPKLAPVAMPDLASLTSGCPANVCGLNGVWLGAGVAFRELHLNGGPNAQGLSILDFRDRKNGHLRINVVGDVLQGTTPGGMVLTGSALDGARLFLGPPGRVATYIVTITVVSTEKSWTACDPATAPDCVEPVREMPVYEFSAVSVGDSCQVEVCRPGLAPDYPGGLIGRAAIFRGDYYDDATYTVSSQPSPDRGPLDEDLFNIACSGTSIYKLHRMRHTAASASPSFSTVPPQRTTLLRLLAADYCGIGHPFTEDGVELQLGFGNGPYDVTVDSGYRLSSPSSIDGYWNAGGASCIGTPRLARSMTKEDAEALLKEISDTCPALAVGCGITRPATDYATSANP